MPHHLLQAVTYHAGLLLQELECPAGQPRRLSAELGHALRADVRQVIHGLAQGLHPQSRPTCQSEGHAEDHGDEH